jgi:hypothetical protein
MCEFSLLEVLNPGDSRLGHRFETPTKVGGLSAYLFEGSCLGALKAIELQSQQETWNPQDGVISEGRIDFTQNSGLLPKYVIKTDVRSFTRRVEAGDTGSVAECFLEQRYVMEHIMRAFNTEVEDGLYIHEEEGQGDAKVFGVYAKDDSVAKKAVYLFDDYYQRKFNAPNVEDNLRRCAMKVDNSVWAEWKMYGKGEVGFTKLYIPKVDEAMKVQHDSNGMIWAGDNNIMLPSDEPLISPSVSIFDIRLLPGSDKRVDIYDCFKNKVEQYGGGRNIYPLPDTVTTFLMTDINDSQFWQHVMPALARIKKFGDIEAKYDSEKKIFIAIAIPKHNGGGISSREATLKSECVVQFAQLAKTLGGAAVVSEGSSAGVVNTVVSNELTKDAKRLGTLDGSEGLYLSASTLPPPNCRPDYSLLGDAQGFFRAEAVEDVRLLQGRDVIPYLLGPLEPGFAELLKSVSADLAASIGRKDVTEIDKLVRTFIHIANTGQVPVENAYEIFRKYYTSLTTELIEIIKILADLDQPVSLKFLEAYGTDISRIFQKQLVDLGLLTIANESQLCTIPDSLKGVLRMDNVLLRGTRWQAIEPKWENLREHLDLENIEVEAIKYDELIKLRGDVDLELKYKTLEYCKQNAACAVHALAYIERSREEGVALYSPPQIILEGDIEGLGLDPNVKNRIHFWRHYFEFERVKSREEMVQKFEAMMSLSDLDVDAPIVEALHQAANVLGRTDKSYRADGRIYFSHRCEGVECLLDGITKDGKERYKALNPRADYEGQTGVNLKIEGGYAELVADIEAELSKPEGQDISRSQAIRLLRRCNELQYAEKEEEERLKILELQSRVLAQTQIRYPDVSWRQASNAIRLMSMARKNEKALQVALRGAFASLPYSQEIYLNFVNNLIMVGLDGKQMSHDEAEKLADQLLSQSGKDTFWSSHRYLGFQIVHSLLLFLSRQKFAEQIDLSKIKAMVDVLKGFKGSVDHTVWEMHIEELTQGSREDVKFEELCRTQQEP